jgi:hypothetical protein
MGFFAEMPAPEPEPPPRSRRRWELPGNEFPGVVAAGPLLLGRGDQAAVAITSLAAYATGFEIFVLARIRPGGQESGGVPHEAFRFGLQWPDGSKVIGDHRHGPGPDTEPDRPILHPYAFGGGRGQRFSRWWAWPLPPPGRLEFVCEWPALGLAETRASIEAQLIRDAAQRSVLLWPAGLA